MSIHNTGDWFSAKAGSGVLGKFEDAAHHMMLELRSPAPRTICTMVFKGLRKELQRIAMFKNCRCSHAIHSISTHK